MDSTCLNMFGIKILESYSAPVPNIIYYTQIAKNALGFTPESAGSMQYPAGGIIEDYKYGSSLNNIYAYNELGEVNAIQIIPSNFEWITQVVVKTKGDKTKALIEIQDIVNETIGDIIGFPLEVKAQYLDDYFYGELRETRNIIIIVSSFMLVSIIISVLGLLAMSIYFTKQRSKEIALRKIYGSSIKQVISHISIQTIILILVSVIIALPANIYVCRSYLNTFPYKIDSYWWIILIAMIISASIAAIVTLYQISKAANDNPINSLKE